MSLYVLYVVGDPLAILVWA